MINDFSANKITENLTLYGLTTVDFELIEDEVDIDNIEEFKIDENNYIQTELGAFKTRKMDIAFLNKINSIIRWANQANKEIKSIKEK